MNVLTEAVIRLKLKGENPDAVNEYKVEPGTIVTPSARDFLASHKISLVYDEKLKDKKVKPEHMTSIRGAELVNKDHPIIRFRGKIDSLEARILETQLAFQKMGMDKAVMDLGNVLEYVHEILRCEVLDRTLDDQILLGMDGDEIRARSHTPKKYYGVNHIAVNLEHGEGVILLNSLRTQAREVELTAYDTFKDEYGIPKRPDIIRGLNRLSSLFYAMMFKVLTKEY